MTIQRRRLGRLADIYGVEDYVSQRGEVRQRADMSAPLATVKAWFIADADRMQVMTLRGDQEIVMFEMGVADHPAFHDRRITTNARVHWGNYWWDVVAPPIQRVGASRHVRHWRLAIRRRPLEA